MLLNQSKLNQLRSLHYRAYIALRERGGRNLFTRLYKLTLALDEAETIAKLTERWSKKA